MKLTKIRRVLKFKQLDWLKKYIGFNADKRRNAANSFEERYSKLMVNSVFGKTMKNLQKLINAAEKKINNATDYLKCISRPNFISQKIFSKNFVSLQKIEPVFTLNKPIYVGFSILDLSKLWMHEFHYKYIKNKFDARLLFTDTDSLGYEIKTEDLYEDLYLDKDLFDFSDYPVNSKFFDPSNKKVIGKMNDEFKGKISRNLLD